MDLADCIREEAEELIADGIGVVGPQVSDLAGRRAPVASGATRDSVDWEPLSRFEFRVFVDTVQGAIQDAGSGPHPIKATKPHGILSDGGGFFVGGSATNPAVVMHPGSTKHVGWFSDIDWGSEIASRLQAFLG